MTMVLIGKGLVLDLFWRVWPSIIGVIGALLCAALYQLWLIRYQEKTLGLRSQLMAFDRQSGSFPNNFGFEISQISLIFNAYNPYFSGLRLKKLPLYQLLPRPSRCCSQKNAKGKRYLARKKTTATRAFMIDKYNVDTVRIFGWSDSQMLSFESFVENRLL